MARLRNKQRKTRLKRRDQQALLSWWSDTNKVTSWLPREVCSQPIIAMCQWRNQPKEGASWYLWVCDTTSNNHRMVGENHVQRSQATNLHQVEPRSATLLQNLTQKHAWDLPNGSGSLLEGRSIGSRPRKILLSSRPSCSRSNYANGLTSF